MPKPALIVPVLLASVVATAQAATGDLSLVSRASGTAGVAADDVSRDASISADGRFVAFVSLADNLSDEDDDTVRNVYVRDLREGTTTHVSRGEPGG